MKTNELPAQTPQPKESDAVKKGYSAGTTCPGEYSLLQMNKTQVVDLGRGKILTKMTRFRMRVFKIDNNIETKVVDLRMREIETTKNNKIKVLARLGKTVCLKARGNDCGKRREIEVRQTGTRKRTRRVITNPTETTNRKTQQKRLINKERKRSKRRNSHQMVFNFTFYTDSV